jgi:hypothetical protein
MCWDQLRESFTIGIALLASLGGLFAALTYRKNGKLKRVQLIDTLYKNFSDEGMFAFYELIKSNVPFPLDDENEKKLNDCLTYFDELEYHVSLGLLNKKSIIYFASEILYFWHNDIVRNYVETVINVFDNRFDNVIFRNEIAPFTGIKALAEMIENPGILTRFFWPVKLAIINIMKKLF